MVKYEKAITYKKMFVEGLIGAIGFGVMVLGKVPESEMLPSMALWMVVLTGVLNFLKNKN